MSSYDYWKDREEEQKKHNITEEKAYNKELKAIYKNMMDECQRDIDSFYAKYASEKGITMAEAKKRASKLDIEEFSRKAEKYVKDKDFSKEANDAMKIYNLTMKVNRLELLKANLGLELAKGHSKIYQLFYKALKKRSIDEFKRQSGILGKTVQNNAKLAHSIVNASFHNATFSDRIWMHQDLLKSDLDKILQTALIRGENPNNFKRYITKNLQKNVKDRSYTAERLLRTEMSRVQTDTQKRSYIENGFDEYIFVACGGSDVCEDCRRLDDGKPIKIDKMMPGLNAPPVHPNCHCSTAPYADRKEYDEWLDSFHDHRLSLEDWRNVKKGNITKQVAKSRSSGKITDIKKFVTGILTTANKKPNISDTKKIKTVKADMTKQLDKLKDDEKEVITRMTGALSHQINFLLGQGKIPSKYQKEIKLVDSAISKGEITEDVTLYRKTTSDFMFGKSKLTRKDFENFKGKIITNEIYTSTSFDLFDYPGRNVIINLQIPKGYKGALYIKNLAYDRYKSQEEVLFKRGLKYKIINIYQEDEFYKIDAEVLKND